MASSLPIEKLDRNNYASWSYKMHQYLLGHGYWSYVDGANDTPIRHTKTSRRGNSRRVESSTASRLVWANSY